MSNNISLFLKPDYMFVPIYFHYFPQCLHDNKTSRYLLKIVLPSFYKDFCDRVKL